MHQKIEEIWNQRQLLKDDNGFKEVARETVLGAINELDQGLLKVAEKSNGMWQVNEWAKKAILLYFSVTGNELIELAASTKYFDKVPLKFAGWSEADFANAGFRVVPGAVVRRSAFIEKNCIIMPSFINVGARIGEGTLVDTYANIGSCAQVGKNCHISMNVGIGGVLEPLQANPVIIEDNVFIGAGSQVVEGVIVEEGAVLAMGVNIGASTKIYNRQSKEITYGKVPQYSVVVPGVISGKDGTLITAAIIVKQADAATRAKTSINDLLRD